MSAGADHYKSMIERRRRTLFASCGYTDRFDPFILNADPQARALYEDVFRPLREGGRRKRLLDLGCGTGVYFDALAECAEEIEAIDISEDMVRVAEDYCRKTGLDAVKTRVGSSAALPFEGQTFDAATALDTLHHVDDLEATLAEAHRVLKPGGLLLVFEPNVQNPLMFAIHAIPPEERRALGRTPPKRLRARLERRFETLAWRGFGDVVARTSGAKKLVVDAYLGVWKGLGVQALMPRQVWVGRKK